MNIDYAETISLHTILRRMRFTPTVEDRKGRRLYLYSSGNEAIWSLLVDLCRNTWEDDRTGATGGPLELVTAWLKGKGEPFTQNDVLHWLRFNVSYPSLMQFLDLPQEKLSSNFYRMYACVKLQAGGLTRYAISRGLTITAAGTLFKQVYIQNKQSGAEFIALGFKNEEGGYSIYNNHIEAHLAPFAITFIRGAPKPDTIHIFKNIFDHNAAIGSRNGKPFSGDCIVLNSWQNLDDAAAYIRSYGYRYLNTWFEENPISKQALAAFAFLAATEPDMQHKDMYRQKADSKIAEPG